MGNNYNVPIQSSYSENTRTKLTPDVKLTSNELLQIINSQTSAKAIADKEAKDKATRLSKSESAYQKRIKTGIQSSQDLADETGAIGDKISLKNLPIVGKHIPEILDVTGMIGNMASGLGRIPLNVEKGDYGQVALSIATPLTVGALAGLGTQNTSQFVNNLVNPLANIENPLSKKSINTFKPQFESEINWGKWNKEIPDNSQLIKEYNTIEQQAKANGTWMKNPDGSSFQGTPEQFVQQNSENFKKAFPEYHGEILNHNTNAELNTIDESFFNKGAGDTGYYGKGTYTHPKKDYTKMYGKNNHEFYLNSKNKGFLDKSNIDDAEYFKRSDDEILQHHLPEYENKLMNYELDPSRYYDNAKENWLNKLNEQVKAGKISRDKLDEFTSLHNPKNGEVVIPFNNRIKSAVGNNGMFDMTNPNIYKTVVGASVMGTLGENLIEKKEQGGYIRTSKSGRKFTYPSFEGQKQEIINRILTK